MTHTCPGPGCQADVSAAMLMCARHWYKVPRAFRSALWRAWDGGAGAGSAEHQAAMAACIRSLEEQ